MNYNKTNAKDEPLDTHLRLFNKVMCHPDLTLLQKVILSDVISFQIRGKQYFKTSAQLAKQMGRCATKTIQNNFQWLNDNGYLDCQPHQRDGSQYALREAQVVQLQRWVHEDEYLSTNSINVEPLVKKDGNHPLKTMWPNRRKNDATKSEGGSTSTLKTEQPKLVENHNWEMFDSNWHDVSDETELTIGYQPTNNPMPIEVSTDNQESLNDCELILDYDELNFRPSLREELQERIATGFNPKYKRAKIVDDTEYYAEVLKIYDEFNPKLKHVTKQFIETGIPQ